MTKKNADDKFAANYEEMDFGCEYSENLPEIFEQLNISLAFTSYQAGKLIFVRSSDKGIDLNYKSFLRPMGLTATTTGITLGVFSQIINFQREDGLLEQIKQPLLPLEEDITAPRIEQKQQTDSNESEIDKHDKEKEMDEKQKKAYQELEAYQKKLSEPVDKRVDACFITRSSHYSGMINIHDVGWGNNGLWVVNSSFSCLCTVEPDCSFVPRWKPYFISELKPEDRCHLNGMALKDGYPAYVTTFSQSDQPAHWRDNDRNTGTLMNVVENKVLLDGLAMPHSPRCYQGKVFFCNSGYGQVCRYDPESNKNDVIAELQGFTRGMDFYGPLLFVGLSKVRNGDVTRPAPIAEKYNETYSGIWIINLENNSVVGYIHFTGNVDQIYDVTIVPDCVFPELIEPNHPRMRNHFTHPDLQACFNEIDK